MKLSQEEIFDGIRSGDKRILGKGITLIESKKPEHRMDAESLLKRLMPFTGNSIRIGISGVPGAGKSTFIESFGKLAIAHGKKVAVLAVDPSSTINKGSILGDKTRMEDLARDHNAFIRPSPTSGFLGGIADATFETMLLCEAAGYDFILVETVGVGQSEVLVNDIVDVFLFIKIIGDGDELQGIKRGIMEMVDIIFINKVSSENRSSAKLTRQELLRALHFMPEKNKDWKVPIVLGSALNNEGLDDVFKETEAFINLKIGNGNFSKMRKIQAEKRFEFWVEQFILQRAKNVNDSEKLYQSLKKNASDLKANPSSEAKKFVDFLFGKTT